MLGLLQLVCANSARDGTAAGGDASSCCLRLRYEPDWLRKPTVTAVGIQGVPSRDSLGQKHDANPALQGLTLAIIAEWCTVLQAARCST